MVIYENVFLVSVLDGIRLPFAHITVTVGACGLSGVLYVECPVNRYREDMRHATYSYVVYLVRGVCVVLARDTLISEQ